MMAEEKKIGDHLPRGAGAGGGRDACGSPLPSSGVLGESPSPSPLISSARSERSKKAPVTLPFYRLPNETPGVDEQKAPPRARRRR